MNMSETGNNNMPASGQAIRSALGPYADDSTVQSILETRASIVEVREALEWLEDDDWMGAELEKPMLRRIQMVYEILKSLRDNDGRDG